ncbi:hypothetical protein [Halopseudomonas oceani]|uniref:hypothetical protein n=2 Tax=Halopseudomonas oceani TaxID=1708783 RepID=UPI002AA7DE66|nr:hypothetical protein [Halopseudomonas oceani]
MMTEKTVSPEVIDFAEARRQRIHDIHDARLEAMRAAFTRALPLPSKAAGKKRKKSKKPR